MVGEMVPEDVCPSHPAIFHFISVAYVIQPKMLVYTHTHTYIYMLLSIDNEY
jgi:hypothetical protein